MTEPPIDLRSDTVTRPTAPMRAAMASAEVGDDVFAEDPSVQRLERRIADLLGKEAALFVPSGSMSNQIGLWLHCSPGDEFICEASCHVLNYEQAAYAQFGGLAARPVAGDGCVLRLDQLEGLPRGGNDHVPRTRLVALENTHNRGAGRILPFDGVRQITAWAHANHLATHLDGARLFNAVVATGIAANRWAESFDTVSVCFSKGLGAPVGSALAGTKDHVARARRRRKALGGGMRQAGVLAAAAVFALEHHVERLAEDHAHARELAEVIRATPGLSLEPDVVDTNIVIFRVDAALGSAAAFVARLKDAGVLMLSVSANCVRAVTHLDLSGADVARAARILANTAKA